MVGYSTPCDFPEKKKCFKIDILRGKERNHCSFREKLALLVSTFCVCETEESRGTSTPHSPSRLSSLANQEQK